MVKKSKDKKMSTKDKIEFAIGVVSAIATLISLLKSSVPIWRGSNSPHPWNSNFTTRREKSQLQVLILTFFASRNIIKA